MRRLRAARALRIFLFSRKVFFGDSAAGRVEDIDNVHKILAPVKSRVFLVPSANREKWWLRRLRFSLFL